MPMLDLNHSLTPYFYERTYFLPLPSDTSSGITSVFRHAFQGLSPQSLAELRHVAVQREYPQKTILCRQGEREHTFYIVVKGRVAITHRAEDGQERLLNICGPGQYFGEMALLDNSPRGQLHYPQPDHRLRNHGRDV